MRQTDTKSASVSSLPTVSVGTDLKTGAIGGTGPDHTPRPGLRRFVSRHKTVGYDPGTPGLRRRQKPQEAAGGSVAQLSEPDTARPS